MNKENKWLVIIAYTIIIVLAIVGPIVAYKEQQKYEVVDDYNEDDNYYKDDEEVEDDYYEDEEIEDETEPDNNMDKYYNLIEFEVSTDSRIDLINSTNNISCLSPSIHGEMFKDEISNNYKLLYTINQMWIYLENNYDKIENYQPLYGDVTISEKVLLDNAKKIFKDVEIPSRFDTSLFYKGTTGLTCKDGTCTFNQSTFGAIGISPINGYETKIEINDNKLIVKQIYVEEEYVDYDTETDTYIYNVKLYDKHNGTLIKSMENYTFDLSKEIDVYEEFAPYYENINTYTYTFDEENSLIQIERGIE